MINLSSNTTPNSYNSDLAVNLDPNYLLTPNCANKNSHCSLLIQDSDLFSVLIHLHTLAPRYRPEQTPGKGSFINDVTQIRGVWGVIV